MKIAIVENIGEKCHIPGQTGDDKCQTLETDKCLVGKGEIVTLEID